MTITVSRNVAKMTSVYLSRSLTCIVNVLSVDHCLCDIATSAAYFHTGAPLKVRKYNEEENDLDVAVIYILK